MTFFVTSYFPKAQSYHWVFCLFVCLFCPCSLSFLMCVYVCVCVGGGHSVSGQTPHRESISDRAHCPQALTELPFFKKKQRGNSLRWMLQWWEAFSSGCFSESPLAAIITGPRGCTLSSLRSCRLLRKSRASDSHDKDIKPHTNTYCTRALLAHAI